MMLDRRATACALELSFERLLLTSSLLSRWGFRMISAVVLGVLRQVVFRASVLESVAFLGCLTVTGVPLSTGISR